MNISSKSGTRMSIAGYISKSKRRGIYRYSAGYHRSLETSGINLRRRCL